MIVDEGLEPEPELEAAAAAAAAEVSPSSGDLWRL